MSESTPERPDGGPTPPYGSPNPPQGGPTPPYGSPNPPAPAMPGTSTPAPGTRPMRPDEERNWAVAAHLSAFLAAYVALGLIGPLVVMLIAGPRSPFVRRHAVEALNFNISVLIYVAISVVLMFVLIGFLTIAAVGIVYLVSVIRGAMAASRGEYFRYPFSIRFVS